MKIIKIKVIALLFFILLVISFGCTKTINVDLKNATPELVIEGIVTNTTFAQVNISKSVQFSSSNTFPPVSGAAVNITDDLGNNYTLNESNPGTYTSSTLIGEPGHTYNLTVNTEGKTYTSTSTMPLQVQLDTLLFEQIVFGNEEVWIVKPQYTDPAGFGNYYKFTEYINGTRYPNIWVWDDNFTNNGVSTRPLIQNDSDILASDTIEVEMQCIDRNVFRYFTALVDVQSNSTTPVNPDTNIVGGTLGYFSAQTSQRKKAIVQP